MKKKKQTGASQGFSKFCDTAKKIFSVIATPLKIVGGALLTVLLILIVCGFVFAGTLGDYLQEDILPAADMDIEGYDYEQDSYLYYVDENGNIQVLQKIFAKTSSQWADYEDIPQNLINAAIAIEDHRFSEHQGVDWVTTIKACARMFFGDDSVGGSSITQQLIKNILLTEDESADDVTVRRKVLEIFRAVQMEKRYNKKTIMEYYLNCIYLGQNCKGVRSAAAAYFGKELEKLSLAECASLISITNSPTYYDPYQNYENNKERKEDVLWAMREYGFITEEEYREALEQVIVLKSGIDEEDRMTECTNEACGYKEVHKTFIANEDGTISCPKCKKTVVKDSDASQGIYSWYVDTVIVDVLRTMVKNDGLAWNETTQKMYMEKLQRGGYHIYTCLDMRVQEQVDAIYNNRDTIPEVRGGQGLQSAIVVVDNRSGDIVGLSGWVGEKEGYLLLNYATDAELQSGSAIKPLAVYAPAFEAGTITPATVVKDLPMNYNDGPWPRNADRIYSYSKTILGGVVSSINAVAANTLDMIGTNYSYEFAKDKFGLSTLVDEYVDPNGVVHSDNDYAPLAMGAQTWGVTVRDMTCAFATFANKGTYRQGRTYTKVYDSEGNLVIDNPQVTREILSEKTVDYMNYCLVNATQSGTGYEANMAWSSGITTAGKTGSTSDYMDRWYCGFTGYYTAAVWCGFKDRAVINVTTYGISNPASYMWKKVMEPLHQGKTNIALYDSWKMGGVTMCLDSGKVATAACAKDVRTGKSFTRTAAAAVYSEDRPTKVCDKHVLVDFCSGGGVATEYCKKFAKVDKKVKFTEKALVKMMKEEIEEIQKAKDFRLESYYFDNDYVYFINDDGSDGVWKGFDGKANKDVSAPYVVCTKHTAETWAKYQKENPSKNDKDDKNNKDDKTSSTDTKKETTAAQG